MAGRDLPDAAATERLGAGLASCLLPDPAGWTILLAGELGAGKSTLARAMLRKFGHEGPVPSPTYTLVEPYEFADFSVYHVDLYRISGAEELQYLAWSDLQDGLLLIEWPERVERLSEQADIAVRLDYRGEGRSAELDGLSPRGAQLVAGLLARLDLN